MHAPGPRRCPRPRGPGRIKQRAGLPPSPRSGGSIYGKPLHVQFICNSCMQGLTFIPLRNPVPRNRSGLKFSHFFDESLHTGLIISRWEHPPETFTVHVCIGNVTEICCKKKISWYLASPMQVYLAIVSVTAWSSNSLCFMLPCCYEAMKGTLSFLIVSIMFVVTCVCTMADHIGATLVHISDCIRTYWSSLYGCTA